ncbi:MAG: hypothetical protein BWY63_03452 [Chloroflexi bacterium ADurb.Bin360]|nr:MAG: hypothetical protein BWY63_03452 [Chloroflexi bacterium ADurb.Bin360]
MSHAHRWHIMVDDGRPETDDYDGLNGYSLRSPVSGQAKSDERYQPKGAMEFSILTMESHNV